MIETRGFKIFRFFGLAFLSLVVVVPLYVVLTTSIKPLADVQGLFTWIPTRVTLEPYVQIWQTVPLASYFKNSLIVTVSATVLSVAMAVLAAYSLARLRFRGQRSFSLVVLSTQMFPGILFLLPLFLIFVQIQRTVGVQLTGSYLGLIITYMTFSLPFSIWMLTGYFASIPKELEEASMIDGTGRLGALFRVIIPVAKPGIIAVAVYAFITAWGEVLFASVLTSKDTRTLSIGLRAYASQQDVYWNQLMAASVVVSLPVLIGFMLVQKHLITGLSSGAVK
ncbi:multiple sugar transport system permease protein [Frigoribacterium sp. PvP120]|jgi:multiple sugar transport system permease protein|uniref:carbohydrate ABC transporter permease n=1 Tax=unclassified Frigoribacterium TaxID=2627005 RepID=UPI0006FCBB1F|nr:MULTISPECIES: carbohydrate ABC transporter permease [unclassified Frigoribacterium]KQR46420.1 ABC transporter permease [Frigoribacterium sp. Leaf164]MBD8658876.1 carbohydrate ABC transporter permease [Frigoribacterium sp. CFBP 8754]MBP1241177.1 multiple sugar transport system permease protein [Frigoribacterium sp. PvP121]QNE44694.1 carbohydrate ABC transporter permease [Frigoribacterium sp. NBH87]